MNKRIQKFDGTPPTQISAAMIRDAFNLHDDAVLFCVSQPHPIEISTLVVVERSCETDSRAEISGIYSG